MVILYGLLITIGLIFIIGNTVEFKLRYGLGVFQSILISVLSFPSMIIKLVKLVLQGVEHLLITMALLLGGTDRKELEDKAREIQFKKILEQIEGVGSNESSDNNNKNEEE